MRILTSEQFVPQSSPPLLEDGEVHLWFFAHWPDARDSARSPALRACLARYLDVATADDVVIDIEANGKPRLRGDLHFNVSHSGGALLIAVSRDQDVGVDLEFSRRSRRVVELAQRWFDPAEAAALQTLPEALRQTAFLRLWTCKEAALKADGGGIASGLHRIAFAMNPAGGIDGATDGVWKVVGVEPAPGYLGAVAWRGVDVPVKAFVAAAR